jgi:hypothetical protein
VVLAQDEQNTIQTDRPDQTETPAIVPTGMFQVETGLLYEKINSEAESIIAPTILWKYGVNENFELRLITELSFEENSGIKTSGLQPVLVGFKAKLSEETGILPKTSFIGHLLIPDMASKDYKADYYASEFRFVMQHTFSETFSFSYNLGAEWDGVTPQPTFIYTAALGYSVSPKLGAFIELYGFAPQEDVAHHLFDGGLTYLVSNDFMVDFSGGFSLTENAPDYFISTGFSFRI